MSTFAKWVLDTEASIPLDDDVDFLIEHPGALICLLTFIHIYTFIIYRKSIYQRDSI